MLKYQTPIPNRYKTIIRPIVAQSIDYLVKELNIDESQLTLVKEFYSGELKSITKKDNQLPIEDNTADIKFITGIETEPIYSSQDGLQAIYENNLESIINDKNFYISTSNTTTKVTLDIRIESKQESIINDIISNYQYRIKVGSSDTQVSPIYHFTLPLDVQYLLISLYNNRKSIETDLTFIDFLNSIRDGRFDIASTITDNARDIIFRERIVNLKLTLDNIVNDIKIEFNNDTGISSVSFRIYFIISTPQMLNVAYNPVYYNKLLPKEFLEIYPKAKVDINLLNHQYIKELMRFQNKDIILSTLATMNDDRYISIPEFDFQPNINQQSAGKLLFTTLTTISIDDKKSLMNLLDIEEYGFKLEPNLLEFIRESELPFICNYKESVLYLTLFEDDVELKDTLVIDSDLNISAKRDLDISKIYRVGFTMFDNTLLISNNGRDRYNKYKDLLKDRIGIFYIDNEIYNPLIRFRGSYINALNNCNTIINNIKQNRIAGSEIDDPCNLYNFLIDNLNSYILPIVKDYRFSQCNDLNIRRFKYYTEYEKDNFILLYSKHYNMIILRDIDAEICVMFIKNILVIKYIDNVYMYKDNDLLINPLLIENYPTSIFYPTSTRIISDGEYGKFTAKTVEYIALNIIRKEI